MMSLFNITHDELHGLVPPLEQAIYNHQQWYNSLIRTLICHLPPDEHDIDPNSYKKCRFGQWYYNHAPKNLHAHPGFVAIGKEHQHMHQLATELLNTNTRTTISPLEYDNFASVLERMRLEVFTLKREIEDLLYNCDPLTRAVNRINMLPILREQQDTVKREAQSCCIAMMDLDNFKKVNDEYGHAAGDKVLSSSVQFIISHLRPYEKVFRYGGEEFLICMQRTDLTSGHKIIERLRKNLAKIKIHLGDNKSINITASFGITLLDPNIPVEQSIDRADKAMYHAKAAGRNKALIWDQSM